MATYRSFEGIRTNIPGVYVKSEFPQSLGSTAAGNVVAILGVGKGGVPYNATGKTDAERINAISSVSEARNTLIGGALYHGVEFFLSPTKDAELNTPSECLAVRVNPATAGSATIQDGSANDIIDLVSNIYGAKANQISRKIEAATNDGHKVTIKFQGEVVVERDDVYYDYLAIQYTGAGTAATMTISATQLTTTVTGGPGGENLSINFSEFPTLDLLVKYINDQTSYTCTLAGSGSADTTTFDAVTGQDIKTSAYTAVAYVQALIDFFNNESSGLLTASLHAAAVRTDVANDSNFVFLANGAEGTASNSDWAAALTLLEKFNVNAIVVMTGDATIQAMVDTHCQTMSNVENGKNRVWLSGAASTTTTQAARIAEMKAINSARSEYVCTPIKRYDYAEGGNGVLTEFAPFYAAALIAGIRYGNNVTISAVFKPVNVVSVTENYTRAQKKAYIEAGGTLFEATDRGITVVHNPTTYQGSNLILETPSMLRTADYITIDMQQKLTSRIAGLNAAPTALQIKDLENYVVTNILPGYKNAGYITDDPNTGDPAFSDVSFSVSGDTFFVEFTAILSAPLHFVFVKQKFTVTGATAAAAA